MTFANIAGILGGAIFGLFIGVWLGWGARTLNITKAGYTMVTAGDRLYVVRTERLAEALERANAESDRSELGE